MLQKLIQNFGTINTSDKPFEKDWCISPMPGKIQQVRLTLNNNKSYDYACRYGVEEGAAAIVGYSLPYYDYDPDDVLGGASTGCFGIVSQVLPTLKIKRSYAVEVDYVFIPSTNKRAITQCVKYLQFGPDDYEKTLQFGKHTATIRPITYFTRQILAAASVLAHPKLAKPDDLELAKNRIIQKKAIDTEMQELEHSPSGDIGMDFSDIQTPDPEIDKVFDLFLPANKAQYDFKEGLLSNGSELFPLVVFSDECIKHISKYPHIAAVSIMIRGGFKNMLEAYLSADPPIGEFYDEMCQKLDGIGYPEVYEALKAYQPTSAPTPAGESTSEAFLLQVDSKGVLTGYTGTAAIVQIPQGVKKIGPGVFKDNREMTSLSLPEGVTEIDTDAFRGCVRLRDIHLPDTLKTIGNGVFSYCSAIREIDLPDRIEEIGNNAFCDCISLESASLPSGLSSIGDSAFSGCKQLGSVSFPEKLKSIGEYAFDKCENLTVITLSPGLEQIGKRAFTGCKNLARIAIPEGVKKLEIGENAFGYSCDNPLSLYLPESLTEIESKRQLPFFWAPVEYGVFFMDGVDRLVVHKGSFAELYAIENNINYETVQQEMKKEDDPQSELDTLFNALS